MTIFRNPSEILERLAHVASVRNGSLMLVDPSGFRTKVLDDLTYTAVFGDDETRAAARWLIWEAGQELGVYPASIHDLYSAGGEGKWSNRTTPAINVRGMAYDSARAVIRAARKNNAKQFIFEIARSEMGYCDQRPDEYATVVLAAAIREGHSGPLFIQGDHFQVNARQYAADPEREIQSVKDLIVEAIAAGFYNIDVDTSTLVELEKPSESEQQVLNFERCAELTRFIREQQPSNIMISVGGEIGEVGLQNSTVDDLHAFMNGYQQVLGGSSVTGISKISVQTGTSHGGTVLPDGTIADVQVDFATLAALSESARQDYGLAGAVQHGASTLPEFAFNRFAEANACEVHLATGFQNIIYDSDAFPSDFRREIYSYLATRHADERKPDMSDAQFYYSTRKRGFGPFKRQFWDLPAEARLRIGQELEGRFDLIFNRLNVTDTANLVEEYVTAVRTQKPAPAEWQEPTEV